MKAKNEELIRTPKPKSDAEAIQGTWTVASVDIGGVQRAEDSSEKQVWTIAADAITIKFPSLVEEMKYHLDETTNPKAIDLQGGITFGVGMGIYELKGDELKICWDRVGGERPTSYERVFGRGDGRTFFILKRAPIPKPEKPKWGEPIDGVQARLRPDKVKWPIDETPTFALDLRNQGDKAYEGFRQPRYCQMELDGKWYIHESADLVDSPSRLEPGKQLDGWVAVSLDGPRKVYTPNGFFSGGIVRVSLMETRIEGPWVRKDDKEARLKLSPGKHTIRVAYGDPVSKKVLPISNSVEFEVLKEAAWGDALENVSARLRPEKVEWPADQAPKFELDLRNHNREDTVKPKQPLGGINFGPGADISFSSAREPRLCRIEFDGKWFVYRDPIVMADTKSGLEFQKQVDGWVKVSLDGSWVGADDKKVKLKLSPGKHTVRVGFPVTRFALSLSEQIFPVSQPVEIIVLKAEAPH